MLIRDERHGFDQAQSVKSQQGDASAVVDLQVSSGKQLDLFGPGQLLETCFASKVDVASKVAFLPVDEISKNSSGGKVWFGLVTSLYFASSGMGAGARVLGPGIGSI